MSSWTAASSDCSRPVNNYVHVKTADLYRPNARLTPERQGYQVLTPFGKLGYSLKTGIRRGDVYAFPRQKSVDHFKDQIRKLTCRKAPVTTQALIDQINPIIRGWGNYFCKAHVRTLFARLDRWIIRRIHAHRYKRWRCRGYRTLPERKPYGEYGLVRLIALIPSNSLPQAPL